VEVSPWFWEITVMSLHAVVVAGHTLLSCSAAARVRSQTFAAQ
jgi:hypothetical protein